MLRDMPRMRSPAKPASPIRNSQFRIASPFGLYFCLVKAEHFGFWRVFSMMKIFIIICFIVFWTISGMCQGPFDPDCYYPKVGDPNGVDTVEYFRGGSLFDFHVRNLGPTPDENYGKIVLPGHKSNRKYATAFSSGPGFDLRNLQKIQAMNMVIPKDARFGHFRNSRQKDMLVDRTSSGFSVPWRIYWADEIGLYDSSRYTELVTDFLRDSIVSVFYDWDLIYSSYLTSDTVEDIIIGATAHTFKNIDSTRSHIVLYRGGEGLYAKGKKAIQDSSIFFEFTRKDNLPTNRLSFQGDFRGIGKADYIGLDYTGNMYFYANTKPFSLASFANSLLNDTLFTSRENPYIQPIRYGRGFALEVMPKAKWDKSKDFVFHINPVNPDTGNGMFVFRGGSEFGSKRLYIDSADFVFHSPAYYGFPSFDFGMTHEFADCGDMTGTGNRVLHMQGATSGQSFDFYYVTGKALDDKADMYYEYDAALFSLPDTLVADNDSLQDIILCIGDADTDVAWLGVIKGSKNIPVRLNPKYAVEEVKRLSSTQMYAFPNPCEQNMVLTFENCSLGVLELQVVNSIGVSVVRERIVDVDGLQQYAVDMSSLPAGAYHIRLVCPADGWSASTSVIKSGAAVTPWKLDLRKMMGR